MKKGPAFLLLAPAGSLFLLCFLGPMVMTGRLSLFQSNYITEKFVGLRNYAESFTDGSFLKSIGNTFAFLLLICPPTVVGSYLLASAVERVGKRLQNFARFAIYVPTISAGIIISIVWKWIFAHGGLADWIVGRNMGWLSDPWLARFAITCAVVTTALGQYTIMFSASMKSMSRELKDAARIDGASDGQYARRIVLPQMVPMIFLVLLLSVLGTMQMWETVYYLTGGGPGRYTATPIYDIYTTAFNYSHHGLAAAKSLILMAFIAAFILIKRRIESWATM